MYKISKLTIIAGLLFVSVSLLIFIFRLKSVLSDYLYAPTSGGESPPLYGIYKIWKGDDLYQSLKENPSMMVYNYLFYYIYGFITKIFIHDAELLPLFTKFITLFDLIILLGILTYFFFLQINSLGSIKASFKLKLIIFLFLLSLCFGPYLSWWYLTTRPDLLAITFEIVGLIIYLNTINSKNMKVLLISTFIFWLAWSIKQSSIFIYSGIIICLILKKAFKQSILSVLFFAILTASVFILYGQNYFEHTILTNVLPQKSFTHLIDVSVNSLITGCYLFLPLFIMVFSYIKSNRKERKNYTIMIFLLCAAGEGLFLATREGSSRNHFFPMYFIGGIAMCQYLLISLQSNNIFNLKLASVSFNLFFCIGLCLSLNYLMFPERFGKLRLTDSPEKFNLIEMRRIIMKSNKPIFIESDFHALPFFSKNDSAEVLDNVIYALAEKANLVVSIENKIKNKFYAEVFVESDNFIKQCENAKYKRVIDINYKEVTHFIR